MVSSDLAEESFIQLRRRVSVRLADRLGVDGEGKPRVRVSETRLRRLMSTPETTS